MPYVLMIAWPSWPAATVEAREPCGTRPAGVRATGPRKTAGGWGCSVSGGGFQAGPEGRRPKQTKMAAVRLPPVRERKRPNGDGFAPRPMIRTRKGRLPEAACGRRRGRSPTGEGPGKGGAGGKTQAGETAAPRPRRAKTRTAQRERLQRRARSPARNVTTRLRVGAGLGRAPSPASAASGA